MIDAVLSWHLDPYTCGVARFNLDLAQRLGVPCRSMSDLGGNHPLISVKCREIGVDAPIQLSPYDLFLHDVPWSGSWARFTERADRVFTANPAIADVVLTYRDDVITAFCPSTIRGTKERAGLRILTFGMAGKMQLPYFEKLKAVLDASECDYSVNLSCAVHEGANWEQTIGEASDRLRPIFGEHFRMLGFLADDALSEELRRSTGVALFYDPAVRANNTTLWAALEHGCCVVTNLDANSPPELKHDVNVWDIHALTEWPMAERARALRAAGRTVAEKYSWDRLLDILK